MTKTVYNRNQRGRNRNQLLFRQAHTGNPYAPLRDSNGNEEDDEDYDIHSTTSTTTDLSPKKPSARPKKTTGKRQGKQPPKKKPRQTAAQSLATAAVSHDSDDDHDAMDEQIEMNKRASTAAQVKKTASKGKRTTKPPENEEEEHDDQANFENSVTNKQIDRNNQADKTFTSTLKKQYNEIRSRLQEALKSNDQLTLHLEDAEYELQGEIVKNKKLEALLKRTQELLDAAQNPVQGSSAVNEATYNHLKKVVVKLFRRIKFLSNTNQVQTFGDLVMDNSGNEDIIFVAGESEEDIATTKQNRISYRAIYEKSWIHHLNEHRNTCQNELRKVCIEFQTGEKLQELPSPDFLEKIMVRDFSDFEAKEGDSDETIASKAEEMKLAEKFFDYYVDKMVPCCAGKKVWHPDVRHAEPMSTSLLPNGQVRVPAGAEALVGLFYRNAHKKWCLMATYDKGTSKTYPLFNPKVPTKNPEWATLYSDRCGGVQSWGGWSKEGRLKYNQLQKLVFTSRKKNAARHLKAENACLARLQDKYQEVIAKKKENKKKRKRSEVLDESTEEELEWFLEDELEDEAGEAGDPDDDEDNDDE